MAEALEWSYGGADGAPAATQRLRFVLDFAYETGLRASELVDATWDSIEFNAHGAQWLHLVGKAAKRAKSSCPRLRERP